MYSTGRDFGIQPNLLGIYTSLLNASFMFCQFLVSYAWGNLSDKYGRRVALVLGLIFSTIGVITFGFATSYPMAMIARCICGLCNGNLGVIKAWLSDITDSSNRGYAFSIIAVSFGFGNVLGSMVGGLLIITNDVDLPDDEYIKTVGILDFWIFRNDFPFLLPMLVGAAISANALFWTLYQVKDENQARLKALMKSNISPEISMGYTNDYLNDHNDDDRDSDLISIIDHENVRKTTDICIFDTAVSIYQTNNSSSLPVISMEGFEDYKSRKPLLHAEYDTFDSNAQSSELEINSLTDLLKRTELISTLLCYVIIALCIMMFREMNPVYMAQALLFNSQYIGYVQAWSGMNLLLFTFFLQPYFLRNFQHRNMGMFNSLCLAISVSLMPSIFWTLQVEVLNQRWIALCLCFLVETLLVVFASILFVISMCFINNSVPPEHCGKANGLAQSLASLVRATGPVITGFIWSESVRYIDTQTWTVYWAYLPSFLGFLWMGLHIFCNIRPEFQFTWEKQKEMEKEKNTKK